MTSYSSALVDFIHAHSQYAHIVIFLLALSEAIPVVGTVVPGSTLIIGISALATGAHANPWILLIAATVGAIVGDGLSFWLGQHYRWKLLSSWPLNQYPQFIARSENLINAIRRGKCVSRTFHRSRPRLCATGSRHPPNVAATFLYCKYPVGTCLGACSYLPWRVTGDGTPIDQRKRRTSHSFRVRGADSCDFHNFCHTLVLQGQVILHG